MYVSIVGKCPKQLKEFWVNLSYIISIFTTVWLSELIQSKGCQCVRFLLLFGDDCVDAWPWILVQDETCLSF